MAGSTDQNCVHGDTDTTLHECLAHLEAVLASEQTEDQDQSLLITDSLFTAALQGSTSSDHVQRLLAILGRESHVALPALLRHSALPVAYILLTSGSLEAQEKGLHLLLENQNSEHHETETPESSEKKKYFSHMKEKTTITRLIARLYAMFVEDRPSLTRRLVAKLLLDTITQASDCGILLLSPEECEIYYPQTASIFCEDKDVVLRFFAGAIIRILYLAGEDEDLFWNSCNPEYRVKFLKCLKEFPENWALAFHGYEIEHHGPRNSRTTPDGDERCGSSSRIINSVTIGPYIFEHDSILLSTTLESFLFILPIDEPISGFQFIDVPKQYILQPTRCDAANKYKHVVNFVLDEARSFTVNGKTEQLGSTICLASNTDFTDLSFSGISPGSRPVIRRASSVFITLDTADEIETKSSGYRKKPAQLGERDIPSQSIDIHVHEELQVPPTPRNNLADEHETACKSKRSMLPDTQESLIFHRPRRSNRNVYKGKPGPSVDWEEDLRPTPSQEERTTESDSQSDADLTSISSPFPGDASIFAKCSDTTQRKKRRVPPSTNKEQPRKKTITRGDEQSPLAMTEVNTHKSGAKKFPCGTAKSDQEESAITTRAGECSSHKGLIALVGASELNKQSTEDQRGISVLDPSVGKRPDGSSDTALKSHQTQNNTNEIDNEPSEIHGVLPKKSDLVTSNIQSPEKVRMHLSSNKRGLSGFAKRLRFDVVHTSSPESHQSGTKHILTNKNGENATKRMKVTKKSQSPVSEAETDLDSKRSTLEQDQSTSSRRRYVVDETGSPRPDQDSANKTHAKFKKSIYLFEDSSSLPRRDSDTEDSNLADQSSSPTRSIDSRHERTADTIITPFSIPRSPNRTKTSQVEESSKVDNGEKWELSLKTAQEAMDDMLRDTSKMFANQLRDERATITGVLETYHQGCNQVLDQLYKAHEERIELYKQQIVSVRRQHRDLCQGLVRQIEDNDRRIAERIAVFSDAGLP